MRATSFLPVAMAVTAMAETQLYALPTLVQRDITAVSSVAAQISSAITQLDTSVKAFKNDATQVNSDSKNLLAVIKKGSTIV
jgi:maltodextrin utilization protein YvdJ